MKFFEVMMYIFFIAGLIFIGTGCFQICLPFLCPFAVKGIMLIGVAAALFLGAIAARLILDKISREEE
ncbi:MAG: hypothetical protein Q8N55_02215 [bacterium]|nr:hypothetical protein [bacterium]